MRFILNCTMAFLITISLVCILITIFVFYVKRKLSYWKRRGLPYQEPEFLLGNARPLLLGMSLSDLLLNSYNYAKSKGYKHLGRYTFIAPVYTPIDLDIVKNILQKDFNYFVNRGMYVNEADDPLTGHLVNLEDERWRNLRIKLTPTFTSGKLKMMFPKLVACASDLQNVLKNHCLMQDPVDVKDVFGRFTTDIIGSCGFGVECNSLKNPHSEFHRYGKMTFDPPFKFAALRDMLFLTVPRKILHFFKVKQTHVDVESFFMNMVNSTVEYREKNNISGKDFMHLLLQLKNRGEINDDDGIKGQNSKPGTTLSMNEIAAQCFVFFAAGFETSATTLTFALLELAIHKNVQDKLREDINSVLVKHDQKLTYEAIMEMTYLDKIVNETLRKHPPFPGMARVCNKEYTIPGTNVKLEAGTRISIPFIGIHRDPEYYPDPEKFDPERFSEENKAKRPPFTYLPFGEGPRICIGARFAMMQVKVGLIAIIKNFQITVNEKTQLPMKYDTKRFINCVKGGVWLNLFDV